MARRGESKASGVVPRTPGQAGGACNARGTFRARGCEAGRTQRHFLDSFWIVSGSLDTSACWWRHVPDSSFGARRSFSAFSRRARHSANTPPTPHQPPLSVPNIRTPHHALPAPSTFGHIRLHTRRARDPRIEASIRRRAALAQADESETSRNGGAFSFGRNQK
eukprot:1190304-Prorocentrum_minimum.AAC.5